MNGPGDIPISSCTATERPCGFPLLPSLGMSCRGRAEAFARHLSSKLRTLGNSQNGDSPITDDDPIMNGTGPNTWITHVDQSNQVVTALQPLRHTTSQEAADSFFDFDCEIESPGSPVDECEYSRLIETSSNTPHDCAPESGYVCSSPVTTGSSQSSDGPYYDSICSNGEQLPDTTIKQQPSQLNGQIKYGNKHTTTPVDVEEKIIQQTEAMNNVNNNNNNINGNVNGDNNDCNMVIANGHYAYEIDDIDETDHHQQIDSNNFSVSKNNVIVNDVKLGEESNHVNSITNMIQTYAESAEQDNDCSSKSNTSTENSNNTVIDQQQILDELQQISKDENDLINDQCTPIHDKTDTIVPNNHNSGVSVPSATPTGLTDESQKLFEQQHNNNIKLIQNIETDDHNLHSKEDTDDDEDCRPQRVRRCSSLKTGKTPPGTPGRKKIVRFADVLGLDLADVKTFMDEIPNIPVSAYQDLEIAESEPPVQLGPKADKILMPLFQSPGCIPSFLDMVRDKQVNLEHAIVSDPINLTITGSVRVRNLDFHKSVHIRYTSDNWRTFCDIPTTYAQNSCDGFSDRFTFTIYANALAVGQRLEFAARFQCKGQQFWDNNYGANYCFQCLPATNTPSTRHILPSFNLTNSILSPTSDAWCVSFY